MKKAIYLFDGLKEIMIDDELYRCYEIYVDRFSENNVRYLTHVLELTKDMSEEELSQRFSEAMYEEIYMRTAMEEDLIAAMRKMFDEGKDEVTVINVKNEMPEEIKGLLIDKKTACLTIRASNDGDISKERIERSLACLYKSIKYSEIPLWIKKKTENDLLCEIQLILEEARFPEMTGLIRNFAHEIFESDAPERIIRIERKDIQED